MKLESRASFINPQTRNTNEGVQDNQENPEQKVKKKKLAPDEEKEKEEIALKLANSHKNVLRKLIAVWIFQMSFCFFILLDTYQSRLSDETPLGGYTWAELKKDALTSNYLKLT